MRSLAETGQRFLGGSTGDRPVDDSVEAPDTTVTSVTDEFDSFRLSGREVNPIARRDIEAFSVRSLSIEPEFRRHFDSD